MERQSHILFRVSLKESAPQLGGMEVVGTDAGLGSTVKLLQLSYSGKM